MTSPMLQKRHPDEADPNTILEKLRAFEEGRDQEHTEEELKQILALAATWHLEHWLKDNKDAHPWVTSQVALAWQARRFPEQKDPRPVLLKHIELDPELQMRASHDTDFVVTLADVLEDADAELDPIQLFQDATANPPEYYIGDGNHRFCAYRVAGRKEIPAIVHPGGKRAAWEHALGANADQRAKPRTRKDLRRAVMAALRELYFPLPIKDRPSQQHIAELCRTSQMTVSRIVKELESPKDEPPAEPPTQLDFWNQLTGEFNELVQSARHIRESEAYLQWFRQDPAKAAEGLTAIADALQQEYRELREHAKAIREGMARSR